MNVYINNQIEGDITKGSIYLNPVDYPTNLISAVKKSIFIGYEIVGELECSFLMDKNNLLFFSRNHSQIFLNFKKDSPYIYTAPYLINLDYPFRRIQASLLVQTPLENIKIDNFNIPTEILKIHGH